MAITIRNKAIESAVRSIGAATGEGPSALIGRLVDAERARMGSVERLQTHRRRDAMRELIAMLPELSDDAKADIDRAADELYDERGLPK